MAKNFNQLRAGMSAAAKAAGAVEHRHLVEEMSLLQLGKPRELTQTKSADALHMGQGDVSKRHRRPETAPGVDRQIIASARTPA